ncbi:5'-nucleotidase C-terminal domain-containing protein [Prevotella sp.]|uniref:5'-nucleotidase C-terminal domain-containing protein n=1 Tax=Prevotella sp. TaxID=59823 RepID=UPI003AB6043F
MHNKLILCGLASVAMLAASCSSHYQLTDVSRSRIIIDKSYDSRPDERALSFIAPYKQKVDSIMSPVVGRAAAYMNADRPESKLSNLLADILVWCGKFYGEKPDFAVYNIGGMRSAFAKGNITYGDVLDVAPFENKICFVTLKGSKVSELFGQIASVGGEAVSHGVNLVISKDGKLLSAKLNGKDIAPEADYRVATIDYVAQGNDKMTAFKSATGMKSPSGADDNVRQVIVRYMKEKTEQGKEIDSKIEGRIKIAD